MENEIWKPCTLNSKYQVSSFGRWNRLDGTIYSQKPATGGYIRVSIKDIGTKALHILVALAFIPNSDPVSKIYVNHINGIRTDNRVDNLEWVSPIENNNKKVFKSTGRTQNPNRYRDLSGEEWKSVDISGVQIRASTYGRIETRSGTKTYGSTGADGYMRVKINSIGSFLVHRIVCKAFYGISPTSLSVVNHKDYNKKNNCPQNLEWVSQAYNVLHGVTNRPHVQGHNQRRVEQWDTAQKHLIATYQNITIASTTSGTNMSSLVQMLRQHPTPRKSAGGYFWKYAEEPASI